MFERLSRKPRPRYARTSSALTFGPMSASASLAVLGGPDGSRTRMDAPHVDGARSAPDVRGGAGVAGLLRALGAQWRGGLDSAGQQSPLG